MGKASKWFRGFLGLKKPDPSPSSSSSQAQPASNPPPKKKWSFVKSYRQKSLSRSRSDGVMVASAQLSDQDDPNKHSIAVAAAAAAVAAAQAAAHVVRLTSSGRAMTRMTSFRSGSAVHVGVIGAGGYGSRQEWAAVKIQSHFRAYLSRRALRALKALVKLQALVRGHIVRKHTAVILREMQVQLQAMLRAQARASAGRAKIFESPHKSNHIHYPGPATPEKFEHIARAKSSKYGENLMFKRNSSKNGKITGNQDSRTVVKSRDHEERIDKILEIDTARPQTMLRKRNLFHSSHLSIGSDQFSYSFTTSKDSTAHLTVPSLSSCEVQSASPMKFNQYVDDEPFCTVENSPFFHSASSKGGCSKRGPFTPAKSDGSISCLSSYSDYPNYMSCTESSKAKMRSISAPKQRPPYERSSSTKRWFSIHNGIVGESRISNPQRVSALHANFANKAYPGSGRLDRLGMPLREEVAGFSGGYWHIF
ncbi:hypothetical protein ACH5RR_041518 [Cinchona calisaya]|uniref:DUF4005 domain-containing protein n=1 Tax=Cinchona calisaya TaxID=153742 RepID=A0ABD2XTU5_9GENT